MIRVKRVYDAPGPEDGTRVLVDRLWPRGLSRDKAAVDRWMKEIAPSRELRDWFGHDRAKWDEFRRRYHAELSQHPAQLAALLELTQHRTITLLFGARESECNNAVALRDYLTALNQTR